MPDTLRSVEGNLREQAGTFFARGKLELLVRVSDGGSGTPATLNSERLSALKGALSEVADVFPDAAAPDQLALLLSPGVLSEPETDLEALQSATSQCRQTVLRRAARAAAARRRKAGHPDSAAIRCDAGAISLRSVNSCPNSRQRTDSACSTDCNRSTSKQNRCGWKKRLCMCCSGPMWKKKWIVWTRILMPLSRPFKAPRPVGRRLDFLMQELNREANTLGSKSTALSTTNVSVEFKVLIEQMREQIQNIE
jgi:uncharacterized protein YicC (UPF0701 family)